MGDSHSKMTTGPASGGPTILGGRRASPALSTGLCRRIQSAVTSALRQVVEIDDPDFADLSQLSLENIIRSFEQGRFLGHCSPERWAATVTRNTAIDEIRCRQRRRRLFEQASDAEDCPVEVNSEGLADARHTVERVTSAMDGLGPDKANVVFLHDALGYELREVADILTTSVAAAQSRLVRGRRKIVKAFTDPTGRGFPDQIGSRVSPDHSRREQRSAPPVHSAGDEKRCAAAPSVTSSHALQPGCSPLPGQAQKTPGCSRRLLLGVRAPLDSGDGGPRGDKHHERGPARTDRSEQRPRSDSPEIGRCSASAESVRRGWR